MKHYGLIGQRLGHSWSRMYFTMKFVREGIDADYRLIELASLEDGLPDDLAGYNVTIPYKEAIIPYLRAIDPIAAEIGAVNVVKDGVGYNTDWIGFREGLPVSKYEISKALILGRGGAAKAVKYVLGDKAEMISARGKIDADLSKYDLIVNATPLGMFPNDGTCPDLDYGALTPKHILFDCVYNPEETEFMRRGKEQGALVVGGLKMLEAQAEASWKVWNNG